MSPAEYNKAQAADRRETWLRNVGYVRTYVPWIGAFAGGALLVWWCASEWWWFLRG